MKDVCEPDFYQMVQTALKAKAELDFLEKTAKEVADRLAKAKQNHTESHYKLDKAMRESNLKIMVVQDYVVESSEIVRTVTLRRVDLLILGGEIEKAEASPVHSPGVSSIFWPPSDSYNPEE